MLSVVLLRFASTGIIIDSIKRNFLLRVRNSRGGRNIVISHSPDRLVIITDIKNCRIDKTKLQGFSSDTAVNTSLKSFNLFELN